MMGRVADITLGLCGLVFLFGGYVQFNDPDPALWVAIYWACAAVSIAVAFRKPLFTPAVALAIIAAVWGLYLATVVFGGGELHAMFPAEEQTGWLLVDAEEAREMGGLAVMCLGMIGAAARSRALK